MATQAEVKVKLGCMNAGKTLDLNVQHHNLINSGKKVIALKPRLERKGEEGVVESRLKTTTPCYYSPPYGKFERLDFILVDESQFLTKEEINEFIEYANVMEAIIIFYGLLRDYNSKMFEGTKYLIEHCDDVEFMKSVCQCPGCIKKATHHVLFLGEQATLGGNGIFVGDQEYMSVCRGCYYDLTEGAVQYEEVKTDQPNGIIENDALVAGLKQTVIDLSVDNAELRKEVHGLRKIIEELQPADQPF